MAKTTAPLLSFGASGAIAKTQVYSKWRGIAYARRHVVPANPRTTAQTLTRDTFGFLREGWKRAPTLAQAPWNAFAAGKPFLGLNRFIGENMLVLRGETDTSLFVASPGANGGVAATSITATAGSTSGDLDVSFVAPTPPTDWVVASYVAAGFPSQDPSGIFAIPYVAASENPPTTTVTLAGFSAGDLVTWGGWIVWTKADGSAAYSVSIGGDENAAA